MVGSVLGLLEDFLLKSLFEEKKQYCEDIIARYLENTVHSLQLQPDVLKNVMTRIEGNLEGRTPVFEKHQVVTAGCAAEAYNNLGVLYDRENDYSQALENYAKAVNLSPEYTAAHYNLGLFFLKKQQWNEALTQFKNVVTLEPNRWVAHYHLANLYLHQENLELAKKHYLEVLSAQPEHSDTLSNLGVIFLRENEPQWAIEYFTQALAFDIHHQDARNNLAATFMQYDRYENAARHYRDLLRDYPKNEEYNYNIAVAYMNLGDLDEAIEHFEYVLENNSKHVDSLNNLAAIYWRLHYKEKAVLYLNKSLMIDPKNKISRYLLSAAAPQDNIRESVKSTPLEYVKNLFDNYAIQYDNHLCKQLQYKVPEKVDELLCRHSREGGNPEIFLDLGCGTGLLGPILKKYSSRILGVDCSEKMLAHAESKKCYEKLYTDDIQHYLANTIDLYNGIFAIEVFEYIGDLSQIFSLISNHLIPEGIFIFSIEPIAASLSSSSFVLQDTARFAHHPDYIQLLAEENHFDLIQCIPMTGRLQEGKPLPIILYFFKKSPPGRHCNDAPQGTGINIKHTWDLSI